MHLHQNKDTHRKSFRQKIEREMDSLKIQLEKEEALL